MRVLHSSRGTTANLQARTLFEPERCWKPHRQSVTKLHKPWHFKKRCCQRRRELHDPAQRMQTSAAPNFNPQNVPDPQVLPSKELGPEQTVAAQLDALQKNDNPWPNHGLQTAYEFGEDIGGMERSRYFGYSKDLYHFDHFMGQFQNEFSDLLALQSYEIASTEQGKGDTYTVLVNAQCGGKAVKLKFILARKDVGRKKGALMTRQLLKL